MAFKFKLTQELTDLAPEFRVGGLYLTNIQTRSNPEYDLTSIVNSLVTIITKRKEYIESSTNKILWEKLFSLIGLEPNKYQPSYLALAKRVLKANELVRINNLVDIYNIISLYYLLPIGGHNVENINEISVGKTDGKQIFKIMGSQDEEIVPAGEFAYIDTQNNRILTRNLVWRQSDYSKVTDSVKSLFIPIDDGIGNISDKIMADIASNLIGLLSLFYTFDHKFGIASKYNPTLDFDEMNFKLDAILPKFLLASAPVITSNDAIAPFFNRKIAEIFPNQKEMEKALKSGRRLRFYMGADCTAPKLHIGHIIPFMKMAELQKLGHQIVFLIGDFTGRIGDPTDKSSARIQMTKEDVEKNSLEFIKQVSKIINFDDMENPAIIVFNSKWNEELKFQDVIDLSTNFTVQQMLERDMFAKRVNENKPIYLHEFMYPLMQGYDSVYMEIDGEFGGKDQTFNMLAGRHLLRNIKSMDKFVITVNTLLSSDGVAKMSKSLGNCIYLMDSAEDKFGKIMAIPDDLIIHYFELVTNLSDQEINTLKLSLKNNSLLPMDAKKQLGFELVKLLDGEDSARKAAAFFENTIQKGQAPINTPSKDREDVTKVLGETPSLKDLLLHLNLAPSGAEAKRLILSGAVEIDDKKITDITATIQIRDIKLVKVGKRNWFKLIN